MRKALLSLTLCLGSLIAGAQDRGFIVRGQVDLPDGYTVCICCHTDSCYSKEVAHGTIKDGKFVLTGKLTHAFPGTLMTNNLDLVNKYHWPNDSIRWTYTDIFLSNDDITVDRDLNVVGSDVQRDFNAYQNMKGGNKDWTFINAYPQSVISIYLANNMLKRGYNLTAEQVSTLEEEINKAQPNDPLRMEEFKQRIAYAKKTTKGGELVDLELKDTKGKVKSLMKVLPKNKFVLVDFWASWCGICIGAMPEIKQIAEEYPQKLAIIAVSIDKRKRLGEKPWRRIRNPGHNTSLQKKGIKTYFTSIKWAKVCLIT